MDEPTVWQIISLGCPGQELPQSWVGRKHSPGGTAGTESGMRSALTVRKAWSCGVYQNHLPGELRIRSTRLRQSPVDEPACLPPQKLNAQEPQNQTTQLMQTTKSAFVLHVPSAPSTDRTSAGTGCKGEMLTARLLQLR